MNNFILIGALIAMTGCSTVDMHNRHSGEKKVLRQEQKIEIKEIRDEHKSEIKNLRLEQVKEEEIVVNKQKKNMKKLKNKQTIEFGVLVANKIKAFKEFFR